jgi:quinol monooxygenase YgiN
MAMLDPNDRYAILINTFQVAPERAEELLSLLQRATEETIGSHAGFVSANLHMSDDRTRIVNYAQWRSKADLEAMWQDPQARVHMEEAARIATSYDPVLYELRFSDQAKRPS